jgi:hypothetical protein
MLQRQLCDFLDIVDDEWICCGNQAVAWIARKFGAFASRIANSG